MPKPDQTEKATPKRREEARKRGQVARSSELAGSTIFLAAVIALHGLFPTAVRAIDGMLRSVLGDAAAGQSFTIHSVWSLFAGSFALVGSGLVLLFGISLVTGILVNVLQTGFVLTLKPLEPSPSKINPLTGFTRMFSKQVVVNFAKQILKLLAVAAVLWTTLAPRVDLFAQVGQAMPSHIVFAVADMVYEIGWKFGVILVVVGLADYAYERWNFEEGMKMTKQEVKDEMRQSEGNPEARAAFKRRQREFARRRMMAAVPRATVVVVNPTHYAVALEWNDLSMEAPVVVAKGADLIAKRIREIAAEHNVPIMENPPLARTLYDKVDIDRAIPPNMYAAVAQLIAFVFKLQRKSTA